MTMHNTISGVGGSLTALVTPFHDTQVDWTALSRLSERQIDRGTAALIVCGSTGEAASLILSEYARAVHTVTDAAAGRVPVIAGCTAMATTAAVALGTEAASAGADALLCAVPPYVKPTQEGIIAHIRAIAHATDLPVVLYDVPSRSGVAITDDTVVRLHDAELIVGLKDATADVSRPTRLRGAAMPSCNGAATTRPRRGTGRWVASAASRSPPTWRRRCARCCTVPGTTVTSASSRRCANCWIRCTPFCSRKATQSR
jgi:4-hydroxy-tetrahydrodipicolinate synthase